MDSLIECDIQYSGLSHEITNSNQSLLEQASDSNHHSVNHQVNMPHLLNTIVQIGNTILERNREMDGTGNRHWTVIICSKPYLLLKLKEKTHWAINPTITRSTLKTAHRFKRHKCTSCGEEFCEEENDDEACSKHRLDRLYYYDKTKQKDVFVNKSQAMALVERENTEILPVHIKWGCCGASLYDKGEISCRHNQ